MAPKFMFLLAGDIGGTNSRLAIHNVPKDEDDVAHKKPIFIKTYPNESYVCDHGSEAFDVILNEFLDEFIQCGKVESLTKKDFMKYKVAIVACFACAGPINKNVCRFTNIQPKETHAAKENWPGREDVSNKFVIDGNLISSSTIGLERAIVHCHVVNDFVGQGYGALDLDLAKETVQLTPHSDKLIDDLGPKVCVGAGTGLGECYLTISSRNPDVGYECFASEGGHVEFAPRSELEVELLHHLKEKFGQKHRVSVERVVSGKGLANVYEFLACKFPDRVDKKVHDEFLNAGDMQGRVVSTNDVEGSLCREAMLITSAAYGSEVGSAALKWIPTGGLYVTGGMTPKILKYIKDADSPFMCAYRDKGRVSPILNAVPLFAVLADDLGLRGARVCAVNEMEAWKKRQWVVSGMLDDDKQEQNKPREAPPTSSSWKKWGSLVAVVAAAAGVGGIVILKNRK